MKWENLLWALGFLILVIMILFFCNNCHQDKKEKVGLPTPQIQKSVENQFIHIQIHVPQDHHAYLDKGKEGNLVPIQFNWKDFPEEPKMIKSPDGIFDEDTGAKVLKNTGIYTFEFSESSRLMNIKDKKLTVRIQICNEVTGICYRPQNVDVNF